MLFKNAFKTLKKRYLQLILLGIIMMLSSFIYTVMSYAIGSTEEPTNTYLINYKQEDFSISMLDVLFENEINALATQSVAFQTNPVYTLSELKQIDDISYYHLLNQRLTTFTSIYPDVELEVRESKDIYLNMNNNAVRIRVLKDMSNMNLSYIVEGEKPSHSHEIAVASIFAENNGLSIGDMIEIHDMTYTISGFVLFPDYSLSIFDEALLIDNQTQTLALMTDDDFEALNETVHFVGAGRLINGYTEDAFESDVIDTYQDQLSLSFVTNVTLTINNMRSGAIYAELSGGRNVSLFMSLLIASIALMIVGIVVSRVIQSQRGPIGILKAIGYQKREIAIPYLVYIGILALLMIGIGYAAGYYFATPMKAIYLQFYLIPSQPVTQDISTILIAVIVPFVFIVGLSYVVIMGLLKQEPLTLLNSVVVSNQKKTSVVTKAFKNRKITTKIQQFLLFRSPTKIIVYLVGMFFASFLLLFTLSMQGIFDRMIYDFYEQNDYQYIGYTTYDNTFQAGNAQETVIELQSIMINGEEATLVGLDDEDSMNPLLDESGKDISDLLNEGLLITKSISVSKGFDKGDLVTITYGDTTYQTMIVGIVYEYTGNKVYMNKEEAGNTFFNQSDYYNVVYSREPLSEDDYYVVVHTDDIVNQASAMSALMKLFVWIMLGVTIPIGIAVIYILTSMAIEDQYYNISLFKVLGYNQKEINHMVLGGYFIYGALMFFITIPISTVIFKYLEMFFAKFYNLLFPLKFYGWHALINMSVYFIIFYVSSLSSKRKLEKIALQETMKMYED